LRKKVLKLCKDKINESLEFFIEGKLCVFSLKKLAKLPVYECKHGGQKYTVTIEWVLVMEKTDPDHTNFIKIFFNSMNRSLKLDFASQIIKEGPSEFSPSVQKNALAKNNSRGELREPKRKHLTRNTKTR